MKRRLAVITVALTALVGVVAGGGLAANQQRLQDGTGDGVPDLIQTHLRLQDGTGDGVPDLTRTHLRLQDGTGDGVPDLTRTHLRLHDGSCR